MGLVASIEKHTLKFRKPATTSRGAFRERDIYLLSIHNSINPLVAGLGECAPLQGLSIDDRPDYEHELQQLVRQINKNKADDFNFDEFPSVKFGLETALLDLKNGGRRVIFQNFYAIGRQGLPINGLVWMDDIATMKEEALKQIAKGFECIKLKIGALDFEDECRLLAFIREQKDGDKLILRVDANGGFSNNDAIHQLKELKRFKLHSIEQPIRQGQTELMAELCAKSPVPIALDEELINVYHEQDMEKLLKDIKPQFLVLKPNLLGGFVQTDLWIKHGLKQHAGWWITSALEGNIGLNAIAQYTAGFQNPLHSGLGTGQLYESNFMPYTRIDKGYLWRDMGHVATDLFASPTEMKG